MKTERETRPEGLYQVCGRWGVSAWRARLGYSFYIQALTTSANIYQTPRECKWFWIYLAWIYSYTHTHAESDFFGHELNWCSIRTSTYIMNPVKLVDCALNQTFGPHCHSAPLSISSTLPLLPLLDKCAWNISTVGTLLSSDGTEICCADNQVNYVFGRG